jgi:integrase
MGSEVGKMARIAKELGPLAVAKLSKPGWKAVGGVAGLGLQITHTGSRSWVLRVMIAGQRRDHGLGAYPGIALSRARELAAEARIKVRKGIDPIEEGRAARSRLKAERAAALTFQECAERYIASHRREWKNAKHAEQWTATLEAYVYAHMGDLLVRDVGITHVMAALEPIWTEKTETASRVRGRIEAILGWAEAHEYRPKGLNPARWRGHLDKLLAAPSKIAKPEHHTALPVAEVGAFMEGLRKQEGVGAKALEFAILTAGRSGEVRGAVWSEIDLKNAMWVIPATRMKAGKKHRVPLSPPAVALLKALPRVEGVDLVFPGTNGNPMSDMTLLAVMRRMQVDAVPHGFRSTFRDWAAERTNYPREVLEHALAHGLPDETEAAYFRSDLFDKRKRLMQEWATFCGKIEKATTKKDNVVDIGRARSAA